MQLGLRPMEAHLANLAPGGPGTYPLQAELDCTSTTEHPVKVREAEAEITAKLDLVGKHGELQARLAKLTAQRSQLRDEQPRHSSD